MKILELRDKLLTNLEVRDHLAEVSERYKHAGAENLETVAVEIQAYLRERPTSNPEEPQTIANMTEFLKALHENQYQLELAEKLQLINSAPTSMPVLFALVEECEQRFTNEQLEVLLDLCTRYLSREPIPQPGEE